MEYDETLRPALRAAGFVTRDARRVNVKKLVYTKHVVVHNTPNVNFFIIVSRKQRAISAFFMSVKTN